jgi:hypothetical protein
VHCESLLPVQVSAAVQPVMATHGVQTRSFVLEQAVLSKVPLAHALVQVAQVSAVPSTRWVSDPQVVHCESPLPVQVSPAVQLLIAPQAVQARSLPVAQAVLSYVPVAQAPAQVAQTSETPSTRCVFDAQVVHCELPLPVQLSPAVQPLIAPQAVQARSLPVAHAVLS